MRGFGLALRVGGLMSIETFEKVAVCDASHCLSVEDPFRPGELRLIARQIATINYRFLGEFAGHWLFSERRPPPQKLGRYFDFTPESRGRKPAMNFAKVGSIVFGPQLPDGEGESIYVIESRKGKKQRLRCVRDGRSQLSQVGIIHRWHADDNIVVFGRAKRGEIVNLRNRGIIE